MSIRIDADAAGPAINRRVIGTNVQWVYGGDNLLTTDTHKFDPAMLSVVQKMGPTVLRYPGGDQSDVYDWTKGVGPLGTRGSNLQVGTTKTQITYMGSNELLSLAETLGAQSLFTVNVVHETSADAAAWVRQTNITGLYDGSGKLLPHVKFWEIGNEPYLPNPDGTNPNTCLVEPTTYVARINQFVPAMRAVDPSIKIGIALANDVQNGIQFVSPGCRGFSAKVLAGLTQSIDFISIHDAYLPYDPTGRDHPASEEYLAAMASAQSVATDLAAMRTQLQRYPKLSAVPFALTEYNASFSLSRNSAFVHSMAAPMGALYVADVMRLLANRDDILMANTWSLSANDHWGAIHGALPGVAPYGRPTFEVFRILGDVLQGTRLTASVTSPTFDSPGFGFSAPATDLPLVTTLATVTVADAGARKLRVLLINKDYTAVHTASLVVANAAVSGVHLVLLTAHNVLETDDTPNAFVRTESDPAVHSLSALTLPAHSVAELTLVLAPKTP